jgi:hypothetical protein
MTPYFITGLLALAVLTWFYLGKRAAARIEAQFKPVADLSAVRQAYKAYYLHCLKKSPHRRGGRVK